MLKLSRCTRAAAYFTCPVIVALNLSSPDYLGFSLPKLALPNGLPSLPFNIGKPAEKPSPTPSKGCAAAAPGTLQHEMEKNGTIPKCSPGGGT